MSTTTYTTIFTATSNSGYLRSWTSDIKQWNQLRESKKAAELDTESTINVGCWFNSDLEEWGIERGLLYFDTDDQNIGVEGEPLPEYPNIKEITLKLAPSTKEFNGGGGITVYYDPNSLLPSEPDPELTDFGISGEKGDRYDKCLTIPEGTLTTAMNKEVNNYMDPGKRSPPSKQDLIDQMTYYYSEMDWDKNNSIKRDRDTAFLLKSNVDRLGKESTHPNCQRWRIENHYSLKPPLLRVKWCPHRWITIDEEDLPDKVKVGETFNVHGTAVDDDGNRLGPRAQVTVGFDSSLPNDPTINYVNVGLDGNWTVWTSLDGAGYQYTVQASIQPSAAKGSPFYEPPSYREPSGELAIAKLKCVSPCNLNCSTPSVATIETGFQASITATSTTEFDRWDEVSFDLIESGKNGRGLIEQGTLNQVSGRGEKTLTITTNEAGNMTYITRTDHSKDYIDIVSATSVTEVKRYDTDINISGPQYCPVGTTATYSGHLEKKNGTVLTDRGIELMRKVKIGGEEKKEVINSDDTDNNGDFEIDFTNTDIETEKIYARWPPTTTHKKFQQSLSNTIETTLSIPTRLEIDVDELGAAYGEPWEFTGSLKDQYHETGIVKQDIKFTGHSYIYTVTTGEDSTFSFDYTVNEGEKSPGDFSVQFEFEGGQSKVHDKRRYQSDSYSTTITLAKKHPSLSITGSDTRPVPSTTSYTNTITTEGYLNNVEENSNQDIKFKKNGSIISTLSTDVIGKWDKVVDIDTSTGTDNYEVTWDGNDIWNSITSSTLTVDVQKETPRIDIIPATNIPYTSETISFDGFIFSDHGANLEDIDITLNRDGTGIDSGNTNGEGEYNLEDTLSSSGTYTYTTSISGNSQFNSSNSSKITINCMTEPSFLEPKGKVEINGTNYDFNTIDIDINALAKSNSASITFDNKEGDMSDKISISYDALIKLGWDDQDWNKLPIMIEGEITDIEEGLSSSGEEISVDIEDDTIKYNHRTIDNSFYGSPQDIILSLFETTGLDTQFDFNVFAPDGERYEEYFTFRDKTIVDALKEIRDRCKEMTDDNYVFYVDNSTFNFRKIPNNQDSPDSAAVGENISSINRTRDSGRIKNAIKVKGGQVLEEFEENWTSTTSVMNEWPEFIVSKSIARPGTDEISFEQDPVVKINGVVQTKGDDYDILSYELGKIEFNKEWDDYDRVSIGYWNRRTLYSFDYTTSYSDLYDDDAKWLEDIDSITNFGRKEKVIDIDYVPIKEIPLDEKGEKLRDAREELNSIGRSYLRESKDPFQNFDIEVPGMLRTSPEQLKTVDYTSLGISDNYRIKSISHSLDKGGGLNTSMELEEALPTMDEIIKDVIENG